MRGKKVTTALITASAFAVPFTASASAAPNQAAGQVNQGNLISALNNVSVQIDRVNALNDLTVGDITVVNVEDVLNNNNVLNNVLNNSLNDNTVLTDFLNDNTVLNEFLNNNDIAISDVVAINVLSGGDVVVFQQ